MSDTSLQLDIMKALADNPVVREDEIAAQVQDGNVVLRGTVGTPLQRGEAVRTTLGVPGVQAVDDWLAVRPMGVDGRPDADTEAAVLDALIADDRVPANAIEVRVDDGVVTLRGVVEHDADREAAVRATRMVPGAAAVRDEIRVLAPASEDDVTERVTNAVSRVSITGAMSRVTVTDADGIAVRVSGHDVTLTGSVPTPTAQVVAVEAAASAPGVLRVHDELTLEDGARDV